MSTGNRHWIRRRAAAVLAGIAAIMVFVHAAVASGLHEEWVESGRWSSLTVEHSPITNPAAISRTNFFSVRGALSTVFEKSYEHDLGLTLPVGQRQSVGFTWMTLRADSARPGVSLTPTSTAQASAFEYEGDLVLFSYAVNPLRSLGLGVNFDIARRSLTGRGRGAGVGIDAGLMTDILKNPAAGFHTLGAAVQNIAGPTLGPNQHLQQTARVSLLSSFFDERLENYVDFALLDPFNARRSNRVPGPGEWRLAGRLTYRPQRNLAVHGVYGFEPEGFSHAGFIGTLNLPTYVHGKPRDLVMAYQHAWQTERDISGPSLYLRVEIGKHRLDADIMLNIALALYAERRWWDAFLGFGRVMGEYPNYEHCDEASYYLARCEEELGMDSVAAGRYERLPKQFRHSSMEAGALLGLMRIRYRQGDYDAVVRGFAAFDASRPSDSLKYHGYYLAGQAHLALGDYGAALPLLDEVRPHHPDYLFAQQSIAVAHIALDSTDRAMRRLRRCVRAEPEDAAGREIVNRCRVMLGYLYFENEAGVDSSLAKATLILRKVPHGSIFFEDALQGLAWTAQKAGQWEDCLVAAEALGHSSRAILRAEALLLKGYALCASRRCAQGLEALKEAERVLNDDLVDSEGVLDSARAGYRAFQGTYDPVAREAEVLALSRRPPSVMRKIVEATEKQRGLAREARRLLVHIDKAGRDVSLSRRLSRLKQDIEYTIASFTVMLHDSGRDESPGQKTPDRKIEKLDREIERLERKMEKLESD